VEEMPPKTAGMPRTLEKSGYAAAVVTWLHPGACYALSEMGFLQGYRHCGVWEVISPRRDRRYATRELVFRTVGGTTQRGNGLSLTAAGAPRCGKQLFFADIPVPIFGQAFGGCDQAP